MNYSFQEIDSTQFHLICVVVTQSCAAKKDMLKLLG